MGERRILFEHVMEPGTGKAVPVLRGQILRIEQLVGQQCADFNAFNLHDYKEHFHCGRTRHMHGLFPGAGDMLWSAPPRDRPMYTVIADRCGTNDVNYPRCSGFLYEFQFGFDVHTNCHDIQAEAQREYGLTPDDVHDSFNFWMHTGVDQNGKMFISQNAARKGDYVELLAHIDTLAVPNVCGADVFATSNFELKPLLIRVYEPAEEEKAQWLLPAAPRYKNQRNAESFKVKQIKATRELDRDRAYRPEWPVYPVVKEPIEVRLSEPEHRLLNTLREAGKIGETDGEIVRYAFFSWWIENKMHGPRQFKIQK